MVCDKFETMGYCCLLSCNIEYALCKMTTNQYNIFKLTWNKEPLNLTTNCIFKIIDLLVI